MDMTEEIIGSGFMKTLEHIKEKSGPSVKVWKGSIAGDPVIVKEAELTLKGDYIVDTVVSGWGKIMEEENNEVKIVNAGCHAFIAHVIENSESARLYIDPVLEGIRTCKKMIFPINPYGQHWTRLVFDLTENKWTHYYSLLPANIQTTSI